jgi:hypothetical protein
LRYQSLGCQRRSSSGHEESGPWSSVWYVLILMQLERVALILYFRNHSYDERTVGASFLCYHPLGCYRIVRYPHLISHPTRTRFLLYSGNSNENHASHDTCLVPLSIDIIQPYSSCALLIGLKEAEISFVPNRRGMIRCIIPSSSLLWIGVHAFPLCRAYEVSTRSNSGSESGCVDAKARSST